MGGKFFDRIISSWSRTPLLWQEKINSIGMIKTQLIASFKREVATLCADINTGFNISTSILYIRPQHSKSTQKAQRLS
jgi:hypothetical protein